MLSTSESYIRPELFDQAVRALGVSIKRRPQSGRGDLSSADKCGASDADVRTF